MILGLNIGLYIEFPLQVPIRGAVVNCPETIKFVGSVAANCIVTPVLLVQNVPSHTFTTLLPLSDEKEISHWKFGLHPVHGGGGGGVVQVIPTWNGI